MEAFISTPLLDAPRVEQRSSWTAGSLEGAALEHTIADCYEFISHYEPDRIFLLGSGQLYSPKTRAVAA